MRGAGSGPAGVRTLTGPAGPSGSSGPAGFSGPAGSSRSGGAPSAEEVAARYGLRPLPVEGGLFRQTWAGPPGPDGRPSGTAIIVLLTGGDGGDGPAEGSAGDSTKDSAGDFSALHRLPTDEVWHFYEGDPLTLLTLFPDGTDRLTRLGGPGGEVQTVVPAGAWMGARVAPGGRWSLFGTTMAPGFLPEDYDGADTEEVERLASHHARHADLIRSLHRADAPGRMTGPDDDTPAG